VNIWWILIIIIVSVFLVVFIVDRIIVAYKKQVATGREDLIGRSVVVKKTLNPEGTVFVEGEIWLARLDCGTALPGEYVVIKKTDGLKLYVSKDINEGGN
jgi:membrane-bound serine protease (ClpP class)